MTDQGVVYVIGFILTLLWGFVFDKHKPEGGEIALGWFGAAIWPILGVMLVIVLSITYMSKGLLFLRKKIRGDE